MPAGIDPVLQLSDLFFVNVFEPSLFSQVFSYRLEVALSGEEFAGGIEAKDAVFNLVEHNQSGLYCQLADFDGVAVGELPAGSTGCKHMNEPGALYTLGFSDLFIQVQGIGGIGSGDIRQAMGFHYGSYVLGVLPLAQEGGSSCDSTS